MGTLSPQPFRDLLGILTPDSCLLEYAGRTITGRDWISRTGIITWINKKLAGHEAGRDTIEKRFQSEVITPTGRGPCTSSLPEQGCRPVNGLSVTIIPINRQHRVPYKLSLVHVE